MRGGDKPLVWLHGEVKTPPLSQQARIETGVLLRRLQQGESLGLPASRPMPSIGPRCHELRIQDEDSTWRLIYRIDSDALVVVEVFSKKTQATPKAVIEICQQRLRRYDETAR
jgi:phage-related protein